MQFVPHDCVESATVDIQACVPPRVLFKRQTERTDMHVSVRRLWFGPTRGVRLAMGIFAVLMGPLVVGAAAEARDLMGAWATDASVCKKIFTGTGNKLSFTKDADVYGSGFIYHANRLKGKIATCAIKTQKQDADVLHLITICSTDVALETVQFSLKIDDDNKITRFFPGMPELSIQYYRCSP